MYIWQYQGGLYDLQHSLLYVHGIGQYIINAICHPTYSSMLLSSNVSEFAILRVFLYYGKYHHSVDFEDVKYLELRSREHYIRNLCNW